MITHAYIGGALAESGPTVPAAAPVVHREVEVGRTGRKLKDTGVADITLLAKYRFYQEDEPGVTTRWAARARRSARGASTAWRS